MTESTTEPTPARRIGATGEETNLDDVRGDDNLVVANFPGANPDKFVEVVLAHPLTAADREKVGLPEDARTEVGTRVHVNRNGARMIINAGLAAVDPEDAAAVRDALVYVADAEKASVPVEQADAAPTPTGGDAVQVSAPQGVAPAAEAPSVVEDSTTDLVPADPPQSQKAAAVSKPEKSPRP